MNLLVDVLKIGCFFSYLTDKRRSDAVVSFYYTATVCLSISGHRMINNPTRDVRCYAATAVGGSLSVKQRGIYIYIYIYAHTLLKNVQLWLGSNLK